MSGRQNRQRLRLMLLLIMTMTGRLNLTTVSLYNPPFSEFTFMGPFSTTSAGWDSVFAPINQVPLLKKRAVYNNLPRFAEPQKQAYSSLAHPLKTFSQNFTEHFFKNFPQKNFLQNFSQNLFPERFLKHCPLVQMHHHLMAWQGAVLSSGVTDGVTLQLMECPSTQNLFHRPFFFLWCGFSFLNPADTRRGSKFSSCIEFWLHLLFNVKEFPKKKIYAWCRYFWTQFHSCRHSKERRAGIQNRNLQQKILLYGIETGCRE